MAVMEKLRMFVAQEPIVTASCLIAGVGLFLPAVVRPILDSFEASKQVPQLALSDVKNRGNRIHRYRRTIAYVLFLPFFMSIEISMTILCGEHSDAAC